MKQVKTLLSAVLVVLVWTVGALGAIEIVLDNSPATIEDAPTRFELRATYTPGDGSTVVGFNSGFRVWTHANGFYTDNFSPITYDTFSIGWLNRFNIGFFFVPFGIDGFGADTIGFGGVGFLSNGGLEDGFSQPVWSISTVPSVAGDTICLDSSFFPPAGEWIWAPHQKPPIPPAWYGPYCFEVQVNTGAAPIINNCPAALNFDHCETADYDFNFDFNGSPMPHLWSLLDGPGVINVATGVWSHSPTSPQMTTIGVEVCAANAACDTCDVIIEFTNIGPQWLGGCGDTVNLLPGFSAERQMTAFGGDCDPLSYSILSVSPTPLGTYSIDGTGYITFNSHLDDGGVYTFTACVSDGDLDACCEIYFDVCLDKKGDFNCDGNVNVADLVYFVQYLFFSGPLPLDCCP
jgi:hypothetical protein